MLDRSPFMRKTLGKLRTADLTTHQLRLTIPAEMTGNAPIVLTLMSGEDGQTFWVEAPGREDDPARPHPPGVAGLP